MNIQLTKNTSNYSTKDKNKKLSAEIPIVKAKSKHIDTVESERIFLILDQAIKNSCLVAAFDTIIGDLEEFSMLLGRQLYGLFRAFQPVFVEYTDICMKVLAAKDKLYDVCLNIESDDQKGTYILPEDFWTVPLHYLKSSEIKPMAPLPMYTEEDIESFKNHLPEMNEKMAKMKAAIQFYVRSILIAFHHNPNAAKCILEHKAIWRIKRNVSLANLVNYLEQLREILLNRLLISPQERDERVRFLASVHRKQKQHHVVIKELKLTLEKMKVEKEKMICQKNSEIIKLQKEIYRLDIDGKNEIHKLNARTEKEVNEIKEIHEANKSKLMNDLSEIKGRYKDLVEKNKENELTVRRRKWKLETETESWINKYDNEMSEYQLQYDKLKSDYDAEKLALAELQKRFEPLEKEYLQVLEERRIAKEKEEAERNEHEALVYWATVIQSFWRAWKARKVMRKNRRR